MSFKYRWNSTFLFLGLQMGHSTFNGRTSIENEISGYSEIEDCANIHHVNGSDNDYSDTVDFQTSNIRLRWCNSFINNHGKRFLELCWNFRLIIANGRVGVDKQLYFTHANTSTIDYCAASLELFHVFYPFMSDKHNLIVSRLNIESRYEKSKSENKRAWILLKILLITSIKVLLIVWRSRHSGWSGINL